MDFKDYFSTQAEAYSKYRPRYPERLFEYLSSVCYGHKLAWDCATGNGQAAVSLTPYFDKIIATDASASQIEHAEQNSKVEYRVAPAENSGLESASFDLVTVATAIHWLDTDRFYSEVKRVLKPGGVIAVWVYGYNTIEKKVNDVFEKFNSLVKEYWPEDTKKAWNFEEMIDFPFPMLNPPKFGIHLQWDMKQFLNYLYTWSSTHNYIKANGKNPVELMYDDFKQAWGYEQEKKKLSWELKIKVGRND